MTATTTTPVTGESTPESDEDRITRLECDVAQLKRVLYATGGFLTAGTEWPGTDEEREVTA